MAVLQVDDETLKATTTDEMPSSKPVLNWLEGEAAEKSQAFMREFEKNRLEIMKGVPFIRTSSLLHHPPSIILTNLPFQTSTSASQTKSTADAAPAP